MHQLVTTIAARRPEIMVDDAVARLVAPEQEDSTLLNDGLALSHARIPGITSPLVALGIRHAGISDLGSEVRISLIFLILTPIGGSKGHLHVLAAAVRLFQDRDLRRRLNDAIEPASVVREITASEAHLHMQGRHAETPDPVPTSPAPGGPGPGSTSTSCKAPRAAVRPDGHIDA